MDGWIDGERKDGRMNEGTKAWINWMDVESEKIDASIEEAALLLLLLLR